MTQSEKRVRIAHLWKKVRLMVSVRGSIRAKIDEVQENERYHFGLSGEEERYLEHDQELESQLPFVSEQLTDLPWYLINPESRSAILWESINQLINWITLFSMPFILAFDRNGELDDVKELLYLAWFVDISWVIDISLKFFTADE